MAFCSRCGAEIREGERFCPVCGNAAAGERSVVKPKRPIWKKWWFWVLVLALFGALGRGARPAQREPARAAAPRITAEPTATALPTAAPTDTPAPAQDAVRPELKEFLDSYEAFMDEYIAYLQKYTQADPTEMVSMLGDYYALLSRYEAFAEAIDELDEDDMTASELAYYLEVSERVNRKLLAAAG